MTSTKDLRCICRLHTNITSCVNNPTDLQPASLGTAHHRIVSFGKLLAPFPLRGNLQLPPLSIPHVPWEAGAVRRGEATQAARHQSSGHQILGKKHVLAACGNHASLGLHPAFVGVNGKRSWGEPHTCTTVHAQQEGFFHPLSNTKLPILKYRGTESKHRVTEWHVQYI